MPPLSDDSGFNLSQAEVAVRGVPGYLFRAQNLAPALCFVPTDCIHPTALNHVGVDEIRYFLSGWSIRNMRLANIEAEGSFLFPDADQPVTDVESPEARQFLRRISATRIAGSGQAE